MDHHGSPPRSGWLLTFADGFDRPGRPDPARWGCEVGLHRNRELQWYQPGNALVDRDGLVIEARREAHPNPGYDPTAPADDWRRARRSCEFTSANLWTRDRFAWRYGRLEVRARFVSAEGLWPTIWTLGIHGPWPIGGEVDVFEHYHASVLANLAWGGEPGGLERWSMTKTPVARFGPGWDADFHTWTMDWDHERIELAVDGQVLNRTELALTANHDHGGSSGIANPFHRPHYLLLNLAIGGTNGGDPTTTAFPCRFVIRHVRIWQPPGVHRVTAHDAALAPATLPLAVAPGPFR